MLAIVSATEEEIAALVQSLADVATEERGLRHYHRGTFHGMPVVAVFSRCGKVAAAATALQLINGYHASLLVFSGVAGAVRPGLAIGDVVVGTELIQHDMDATPIFPRYEIPLLGKAVFAADATLSTQLTRAAREFLAHDLETAVAASERAWFRIGTGRVVSGLIASGDKFFASAEEIAALRARLPEVCCVEMEGAAVAQVCHEYGVRFGIVRTISDLADGRAGQDFARFSREIAGCYSAGILSRFLRQL